jgi:hypothetical protein
MDVSLLFGAIDLEIAQHGEFFFSVLEKNKRVGNEKADRIEHVGIALAGCDEQNCLIAAQFHGRARVASDFRFLLPGSLSFEHQLIFRS